MSELPAFRSAVHATGLYEFVELAFPLRAHEGAAASRCLVVHGGQPRGYTCLDEQRDARLRPIGGTPAVEIFRRATIAGDWLCNGCTASLLLAQSA